MRSIITLAALVGSALSMKLPTHFNRQLGRYRYPSAVQLSPAYSLRRINSMLFLAEAHPWIPAGPNDSRSPCPALNALANHDIL